MLSAKVIITIVIILGIGVGTGALVFGILLSQRFDPPSATFTAIGSAVLAASVAALVAHIAGGFRELGDDR